ncbi:MAG: tyrosine-type recombinase/integrase [Mucilaginibacter sp.]
MQKEKFFIALSYKIVQRSVIRADGTSTIMLRVIVNRRKKDFNLNVAWPQQFFAKAAGLVSPRDKTDLQEAANINLIINQATAKAHNIKMAAFAQHRQLTLEEFAREFEDYDSKENFIWYWRKRMNERLAIGSISKGSFKHHRVSLDTVLVEFVGSGSLNFNQVDLLFLQSYEAWLMKKYMYNTCVGHLKNMKTYLNLAKEDGYTFTNPFDKFKKLSYRDGFREALEKDELKKLILLLKKKLLPIQRSVLERFLFSCFTGIRISDSSRVTSAMIHSGVLSVKMKKGERYGKVVHIPLPGIALKLVEGRKGKLFGELADQTINDQLKILAGIAGIEKPLTYRVSRDTFGSQFIEMGGDPVTLKELMGHTSIATTMIYVKISERRKEMLMSNFDKFYGKKAR